MMKERKHKRRPACIVKMKGKIPVSVFKLDMYGRLIPDKQNPTGFLQIPPKSLTTPPAPQMFNAEAILVQNPEPSLFSEISHIQAQKPHEEEKGRGKEKGEGEANSFPAFGSDSSFDINQVFTGIDPFTDSDKLFMFDFF